MNNQAFIDGQNLTLSTKNDHNPWKVDLYKFRKYLSKKYGVKYAFYFLGFMNEDLKKLYLRLQDAGFILIFRSHNEDQKSNKKGNVDTDVVFTMMKNFHEENDLNKVYLVSGDGDYFKTTNYLKKHGKLGKVLFPTHERASSLYRKLGNDYYDYLDWTTVKDKIELKEQKRGSSLR